MAYNQVIRKISDSNDLINDCFNELLGLNQKKGENLKLDANTLKCLAKIEVSCILFFKHF